MSFFAELKRRNVVRVGTAYVVIGWVLAQVAEFAFENFGAPDWVLKTFVTLLLLGLPIALFFAWAFELTPEGIKREKDVDRGQSITGQTGRKLDRVIIGVLAIAVAFLLVDEFVFDQASDDVESVADAETDISIAEKAAPSIAVLPFVNLSEDEDHFADGLSEELMNLLARIPELKVAGRTSSFYFKGKTDDIRNIGTSLGVAYLLEGSVRRSDDTLRVTARLSDAEDGDQLWLQTYQREMADIFDIQDDVAASITKELELRLAPEQERPTENARAYALYLQALPYITNNDDPNLLEIVVELIDEALELDPDFAKAHEAKAMAYWHSAGIRIDADEAREHFVESAKRAVELDSTLVFAKYIVALYQDSASNWISEYETIESLIEKKEKDDFDMLRIWCSWLITGVYIEESLECAKRMISVEPLSPIGYWRAGHALAALGQHEAAHENFSQASAIGGSIDAWELVFEAANAGDFDRAAELALAAPKEFGWQPEDIQQVRRWLEAGEDAAITDWIRHKAEVASNIYDRNNLFNWYLTLGEFEKFWSAITGVSWDNYDRWGNFGFAIERAISVREKGSLRHPGFLEFARKADLLEFWDQRGAPDVCSKDSGEWVCD